MQIVINIKNYKKVLLPKRVKEVEVSRLKTSLKRNKINFNYFIQHYYSL